MMNRGINCLLSPSSITLSRVQSVKDAFDSSDTLFYILTSRSTHLPCEQGTIFHVCFPYSSVVLWKQSYQLSLFFYHYNFK